MTMKMSFEGELYYGGAGSSASTKIIDLTDVNINFDHQKTATTVRGDGSAPPIRHERIVERVVSVEFTLLIKSSGTGAAAYAAMMAAVANATPIAIRGKDYANGKGPDFDATLTGKKGEPHGGLQTFQFTATPTDECGRTAQLYV
jgi:hypothetical protein